MRSDNCSGAGDHSGRSDTFFLLGVDACFLSAALALGAFNRQCAGICRTEFFRGHFNDLMAGVLFPAYVNLMLAVMGLRMHGWIMPLLFTLAAGIFWEYVTPLYRPQSVSDPWDVAAYLLGALNYCAATALIRRRRETKNGGGG